uniref:Uncharacterized protein n=1 Tax=Setaria italica TaxID=4555 RepID=K3YF29_SETIT
MLITAAAEKTSILQKPEEAKEKKRPLVQTKLKTDTYDHLFR